MEKVEKNNSSIDFSLKQLEVEAMELFKLLDITSDIIRRLEKNLSDLKANFPFKKCIKIEKQSSPKLITEDYRQSFPFTVLSCHTQVSWYLAWQQDESTKNFRLFLTSIEVEKIYYNVDSDKVYNDEIQSKCLYKKPLIETDIQTRLQYSEHLISFIDSFKDYLKNYRISIETSNDYWSL